MGHVGEGNPRQGNRKQPQARMESRKWSFIPPKGGVYKALVTVKDLKGNTHQSSTYIWVAGDGEISWRQTNDRAFSLIADKDMYEPGDTAEILIAQPFTEKVYALITYERGHIYKQEVVQLEGNSTIYKLPITDEMAPIAYISVTVISGAEQYGRARFQDRHDKDQHRHETKDARCLGHGGQRNCGTWRRGHIHHRDEGHQRQTRLGGCFDCGGG